jgi:tetratricopeptide (TPR) repeat protein
MKRHFSVVFIIVFTLVASASAPVFAQTPPLVPKLTDRGMDKASYVELAKQWKRYIDEHGESVQAFVQMGMAYHYSGQMEAAYNAAQHAVEVDDTDPEALAFLAKITSIYKGDQKTALELLERCIALAPDHEGALITMTAAYMKSADLSKSDEVLEKVFDQRIYPRALQDLAYNMLVGLPKGAVLITNGDTDTFPQLSLQAGMDFRKDVAVINRHLLNIVEYAEAIFDRYPSIKPSGEIKAAGGMSLQGTLVGRMVADKNINVYFASSVNPNAPAYPAEMSVEGVNLRSAKGGMTPEESARLLMYTYRMDSATDWTTAWDLMPSVVRMLSNYVICAVRLAGEDGLGDDTRKELLEWALEIAEHHDMDRLISIIRSQQKS